LTHARADGTRDGGGDLGHGSCIGGTHKCWISKPRVKPSEGSNGDARDDIVPIYDANDKGPPAPLEARSFWRVDSLLRLHPPPQSDTQARPRADKL